MQGLDVRVGRGLALAFALILGVAMLALPSLSSGAAPSPQGPISSVIDPTTSVLETTTTEDATTSTVRRTTTTVRRTTTTRATTTSQSTTTLELTTSSNVLVPGDGTGDSGTTTTTEPVSSDSEGLSDKTIVIMIMAALLVVAGLLAFLTWRYWRSTRPMWDDEVPAPAPRQAPRDPGPSSSVFR